MFRSAISEKITLDSCGTGRTAGGAFRPGIRYVEGAAARARDEGEVERGAVGVGVG
jgi:hypothetical protein